MTDLAEMWSELVDQAMEIDPPTIRRSILATRDDGLRATSYDGSRVMGGTVDSHPERLAMHPPTDHTDADLRLLDNLVASYVQAVAEIAVRSRSGRPCETWEEAVKDHHLLDQMDAVSILERIENPRRWVLKAGDALHDLARLAHRHSSRAPEDWEQSWTSGLTPEECCRLCHEHVNLLVEVKAKRLCQMHLRLYNEAGEVDPPEWLTQEYRRIGSPAGPDWKKARSRWLQSLGVPERRVG